jgi:hypothetical protein
MFDGLSRNQPTPKYVLPWGKKKCVLGRFSLRGVQKHDLKQIQKVHVENFFREIFKKIDKNFDVSDFESMSVFPRLPLFHCVFRCYLVLSDGSSKALQNKSCRKVFTKKSTNGDQRSDIQTLSVIG